ncbi:hypothetical protein HC928_16935 [bacterium]|nr:hypothetical protein [bacterium]
MHPLARDPSGRCFAVHLTQQHEPSYGDLPDDLGQPDPSSCSGYKPAPGGFFLINESADTMTSRLFLFVFLLFSTVVVAACAPAPELRNDNFLADTSFITGEPCGPPCWRGITVGETAWADALTIIEDDATLADLEERSADDSTILGAIWGQAGGDGCCQMYSEDGEIVDVIILQTAPQATLGEVIDTHGDPAYLIGET